MTSISFAFLIVMEEEAANLYHSGAVIYFTVKLMGLGITVLNVKMKSLKQARV